MALVPESASYTTNSLDESQPVMISRAGVGSLLSRIPTTRGEKPRMGSVLFMIVLVQAVWIYVITTWTLFVD